MAQWIKDLALSLLWLKSLLWRWFSPWPWKFFVGVARKKRILILTKYDSVLLHLKWPKTPTLELEYGVSFPPPQFTAKNSGQNPNCSYLMTPISKNSRQIQERDQSLKK